jgi:hypothetical protein
MLGYAFGTLRERSSTQPTEFYFLGLTEKYWIPDFLKKSGIWLI